MSPISRQCTCILLIRKLYYMYYDNKKYCNTYVVSDVASLSAFPSNRRDGISSIPKRNDIQFLLANFGRNIYY